MVLHLPAGFSLGSYSFHHSDPLDRVLGSNNGQRADRCERSSFRAKSMHGKTRNNFQLLAASLAANGMLMIDYAWFGKKQISCLSYEA